MNSEQFFYADYDEPTGLYCVFNEKGKAVSSWSCMEQAQKDADRREEMKATR